MEVVKDLSALTVVLPPISPGAASPRQSTMDVCVDPMTPRVSVSSVSGPEPPGRAGGPFLGGGYVPVVTPVAAPPTLTLAESDLGGGGVPKAPVWKSQSGHNGRSGVDRTMSYAEEVNETQEAAVLLTALSAIATKEVRVDSAVEDLLRLSSSSSSSSGPSSRPAPPLPDLGPGRKKQSQPQSQQPQNKYASGGSSGAGSVPILSLRTAAEIQERRKAAEELGGRRQQRQQQQQRTMNYHFHAPLGTSPQESSSSMMRVRAVSIDAVMGVASDLSLPCEPCYRESDEEDNNETPPPPSPSAAAEAGARSEVTMMTVQQPQLQQQQKQQQKVQVLQQVQAVAGAFNLVSPPSSPAFKPRIAAAAAAGRAVHGGGVAGSSSSSQSHPIPRSADRRKRFLDLHGTDCAAFQLPSSSSSSSSPPLPPPPPTTTTPAAAAASFHASVTTAAAASVMATMAPPSSPRASYVLSAAAALCNPPPSSSAIAKCKIEGRELPASHGGTLQPVEALSGRIVKIILRKKFSWKNYPELERFLVANREEYLRHSALNYTVQQKRYNNRLTDRLLQLATEHGYVFDETDFSFVTVRDRIRCYFKSYVQSSKKRGLVVGYAARRAGLLTRDELERSAGTAGRIFVPGKEVNA